MDNYQKIEKIGEGECLTPVVYVCCLEEKKKTD